jgi:IS4 transposase
MNVVGRGAKTVRLAAGSTHEIHLLQCGRWLKGRLLIFDLGYFRTDLFREIGLHGGYYLARIKRHINPLILGTRHGIPRRMVGRGLKDARARMSRRTRGIDIDVELRYELRGGSKRGRYTLPARIVGVRDPKSGEMHMYVTNAPAELLDMRNVAAIYASRWEVELLFRELKTVYRLGEIPTRKRWVTECLIYSALLTLLVSRALHRWLLSRRPKLKDRVPFDRFAVLLESLSHDILDVLIGPRPIRERLAKRLKWLMLHEAVDPNRWRLHLTQRAQMGTLNESRLCA